VRKLGENDFTVWISRADFGENEMSKKLLPTHKLKLVRSISGMRLNNFGADIYTGADGKAYIVCDKLMSQIPFANVNFGSLEAPSRKLARFMSKNGYDK